MSGKKNKIRSLRNILETPFQTHWLDKSEEEIVAVQNALKECLPAGKLEHETAIPHLKGRKETKRNKNEPKKRQQNIYRTYLAPGFQSVIRGLEKQELCCVVLSKEVTPALLQKVVLAQAQASCIPVVVIPHLKDITKSALGFASMVLGFKNVVANFPENKFHSIYRLVLQNQTVEEPSLMLKIKEEEIPDNVENPTDSEINKCFNQVPPSKQGNLYLYRQSSCERVFEPKRKTNSTTTNLKSKIGKIDDFISLEESLHTPSSSFSYLKKECVGNNYSDNCDDDSSDSEQADFFVDNTPDDTLLNIEELQPSKSELNSFSQSKKKKAKHFVHEVNLPSNSSTQKVKSRNKNITGVNKLENKKQLLSHKNTSNLSEGASSTISLISSVKHSPKNVSFITHKAKKELNSKMSIPNKMIFKSLKIKSVKSNSKKAKTKNKNKRPI